MFARRNLLLFGGSVLTIAQSYNLFSVARRLRNSQQQEVLRYFHARIEPRLREKREAPVQYDHDKEPEWFLKLENEKKQKTKKKDVTNVNRRHKELPEPEDILESANVIPRPVSLIKPGLATAVRWNLDLFHFYHITNLERTRKLSKKRYTQACTDAIQWFLDESEPPRTLQTLYRSLHREVISRYLEHGHKSQADLQWFFDFLVSHPCGDIALMMDLEDCASNLSFSLCTDRTWHDVLAKACRHNYPDSSTLLRGLQFVKFVPDWLFDCLCRHFAVSDPDSVRELLSWKRDQSRLRVDDLLHFRGEHMAQSCRRYWDHCIDRDNAVSMQKLRWKLVFEACVNPKVSLDDLVLLMQPDLFQTHTSSWKVDASLGPYLNHALAHLCDTNSNPELTKEVMDLMLAHEIPFTEAAVKRAVRFSLNAVPKSLHLWFDIAQRGPIDSHHENFFQLHKSLSPKQQEHVPETYFIPSFYAGRVLGEGGQTIAQIRQESGARVEMMPHEEGKNQRMIRISGKKEERELAVSLLESCTLLQPKEQRMKRAGLPQRIECITEGFLASQNSHKAFEWLDFLKSNFQVDRKKLCQKVIRGKIERSAKFGILESLHTYESIFGNVPNAIVDKAMRMCAVKGNPSLGLDLFETLQKPGRSFTKDFYADLLLTLLKHDKPGEAAHILKRSADLALDTLQSLQQKLPSLGKLTFSDRQLLFSFDQLRENHLLSDVHQWKNFAKRDLIRFQDKLKLDLEFEVLSDRQKTLREHLSRICKEQGMSFEKTISGRCIRIYVKGSSHFRNLPTLFRNLDVKAISHPRIKEKGFLLFLKTKEDVDTDIAPNGINFSMKHVEMTDVIPLTETEHLDVSNDWLPKRVQVERVFVNWMVENDIVPILNALKDVRWIPMLHSKTIALPLARFLSNHGQLDLAMDVLARATPLLKISPMTFISLTTPNSALDFACLTKSENTRKRDPPKIDAILSCCVTFLHLFDLKATPALRKHLETLAVGVDGYASLREAFRKLGYAYDQKTSRIVKQKQTSGRTTGNDVPRFLEAA